MVASRPAATWSSGTVSSQGQRRAALRGLRRGEAAARLSPWLARAPPAAAGRAQGLRSHARSRRRGRVATPRRRSRKSDPTGMIIGIGVAIVLIGIAYVHQQGVVRARGRVRLRDGRSRRARDGDGRRGLRVAFQPRRTRLTANQRAQVDARLAGSTSASTAWTSRSTTTRGPVARRSPQGPRNASASRKSSPCSPLREALKWFMGGSKRPRTPGSRGCSRASNCRRAGLAHDDRGRASTSGVRWRRRRRTSSTPTVSSIRRQRR